MFELNGKDLLGARVTVEHAKVMFHLQIVIDRSSVAEPVWRSDSSLEEKDKHYERYRNRSRPKKQGAGAGKKVSKKTGRLGNSGYTLKRLFIVQHLKANSGPLWCGSWSLVPQEIKKEEEQDPDPHQYNAYQQHLNYTLPYYRVWEEAGRAGVGVVRVVAGVEAEDSELPFAPSTGIGFKQEIK